MSLKEKHNTFDTVFEKFVESFEFLWRGTTQGFPIHKDFKDFKDFKDSFPSQSFSFLERAAESSPLHIFQSL